VHNRGVKIRMVEHVIELCSQDKIRSLRNLRVFHEREVSDPVRWAADGVSPHISETVWGDCEISLVEADAPVRLRRAGEQRCAIAARSTRCHLGAEDIYQVIAGTIAAALKSKGGCVVYQGVRETRTEECSPVYI